MIGANDDLGLSPNSRIHVILITGFAGFDALGQLEYYAGVTPLFRNWQKKHKDRPTAVLHYFDNFPTAAVATRSELLRQYIVKRIARGEFTNGDRIALIGHSTGGLDIRLPQGCRGRSRRDPKASEPTCIHFRTTVGHQYRGLGPNIPHRAPSCRRRTACRGHSIPSPSRGLTRKLD